MSSIFNPDFRDFIQSLNNVGVAYLLVGGYAVILHGRSRTTGDMDIWVKPSQDNYRLLADAFLDFGLPIAAIPLEDFLSPEHLNVFSFGREPVAIDIMTAVKGLDFDTCYQHSGIFEDDGLQIRTIRKEDLLIAKRAAGRYKDLDDLEHL